jgi:putative cardiolipin synthase
MIGGKSVRLSMRHGMVLRVRRLLLPAAAALLCAACATLRPDLEKPASTSLPPTADSPPSLYIARELAAHAGLSGFRLLTKSNNALMSRVALADQAQHSIDLQYYIFNNDATGRLLAQRLLQAADRGVRVRMLIDDINSGDAGSMLETLSLHKNIQVRFFNPFHTRDPSLLSKAAQLMLEGRRLNRRMHNKAFIVDGWAAVIGGRNIGDEYFDAGAEANFRDLDVVAIGPVVASAANTFDAYWNCDASYRLKALRTSKPDSNALEQERAALARDARTFAQSDYAQAVIEDLPQGATGDRPGDWFWGNAELVADDPAKVTAEKDEPSLRIGPKIRQVLDAAASEVILISPYFVPGDTGTAYLSSLVKRGVATKVLTNSLASNDELAAHAGYAHYRPALLEAGVELYELRPAPGEGQQPATSGGTSSGVSLHAKAVIVDERYVFVGSMNLDQRSKLLNTEMGVIVDSPGLAAAVKRFFDTAVQPDASFKVSLQRQYNGNVPTWSAKDGDKVLTFHEDPDTSAARRFEVSLIGLLPIESLL